MAKLTHLVIHCTATPVGMEVTSDMLKQWHLGPAKNADGTFRYKGTNYKLADLPKEKIGGIDIKNLIGGRGWRQVGYADLIHLDGRIENVVPYNDDDNVDAWEITNGILSSNPIFFNARHVVYAGGMDKANKNPEDTRTTAQMIALLDYVKATIKRHPNIIVAGHNQFDNRACPSFSVVQWALAKGIARKNICNESMKYTLIP